MKGLNGCWDKQSQTLAVLLYAGRHQADGLQKGHPLPFLWHEGSPRVTNYDPQYYTNVYEF